MTRSPSHRRRTVPKAVLAFALVASGLVATAPLRSDAAACPAWTKTQVAKGYGVLENLSFDGQGGMLLSQTDLSGKPGAIKRLTAAGVLTTVVPGVTSPGGQ